MVGVARQLRRFTVERVARQADNTEQPLQPLATALLGPVECRALRVGVNQRDALSTASPFASEVIRASFRRRCLSARSPYFCDVKW